MNLKLFRAKPCDGASTQSMLKQAADVLTFIKAYYPEAEILVGGSVAFYECFPQALEYGAVMNDVDASLLLSKENTQRLYDELCEDSSLKKIDDTQIIAPMGVVDLHVCRASYNNVLSSLVANSDKKGKVHVMSAQQVFNFYSMLNRPKDQKKIEYMKKRL